MPTGDKIMFEIYREERDARHRVVYYTELGEHDRNTEIERAMRGETVFNGFLRSHEAVNGKAAVMALLAELDKAMPLASVEIAKRLAPFLAE